MGDAAASDPPGRGLGAAVGTTTVGRRNGHPAWAPSAPHVSSPITPSRTFALTVTLPIIGVASRCCDRRRATLGRAPCNLEEFYPIFTILPKIPGKRAGGLNPSWANVD